MSLDKQKILNDLGNVMNQLQSADCGCMGNIFGNSNPNQNFQPSGAPLPTCGGCRRGCCHGHGYNMYNHGGSSGDYCNNMNASNTRPCMGGRCNPAKLYADTYSYLSDNVMQPTVQEVYNDLKSITPANTIMNNPMAQQMGLSASQNPQNMGQSQITGQINAMAMNPNAMSNQGESNINGGVNQLSTLPAGMGPNIVNMMMSGRGNKPVNVPTGGKLTEPMLIDAPNSPHGKVGVQPLTSMQGHYDMSATHDVRNIQNSNIQSPQTVQHVTGHTNHHMNNLSNTDQHSSLGNYHGHHRHGNPSLKFNEMFPGVMKPFGDDLGFDPMAIAIQMNPDNAKRAAMETMQNMMYNGRDKTKFENLNKNVIAEEKVSASEPTIAQPTNVNMNRNKGDDNPNFNPTTNQTNPVQQIYTANSAGVTLTQPQEQVVAGFPPEILSGTGKQEIRNDTQQMQQNSNPISNLTPEMNRTTLDIKNVAEPIFPVDTSRNQPKSEKVYYQYNTLGQPVELLPADMYHIPEQSLPQTLSPTPIPMKQLLSQNRLQNSPYSNVKSTISKTSIMGQPNIKANASKSQLQHLYNQYRGSQSFTQQNIQAPVQKVTHSDGRLNESHQLNQNQAPVEKVGGDSSANNAIESKMKNVNGHLGDIPVTPTTQNKQEIMNPMKNDIMFNKGHNGLQDVVFTSYPTTAAWSFHGRSDTIPYSSRYFQRKI